MTYEEALSYFKMRLNEVTHPPTTAQQKAFSVAIEAIEKADKYRWHNLRENPDDLPVLNIGYEYVEVITAGNNNLPFPIQYDDATMKFGEWRALYDAYSLGYVDSEFEEWNTECFEEIIAWRYIEAFKAGEQE